MSDTTPPIVTSNIPSGWNQVNTFIVQLSAVDQADTEFDTPSGVKAIYYTTDGTDPDFSSPHQDNTGGDSPFIAQFTVSGQGNYTVKYFATDNNDISSLTKTDILLLDDVAPSSSASASFPADGENGWYKTNTTITLASTDSVSGLDKIFYRWNTDPFAEYLVPFQLPNEGVHTLQFFATDIAGNVEEVNSEFYKLDNISPQTTDDAPSGEQKDPVTVTFFYSDDVSGVATTHYTTDGSTPDTSSPSGSSVLLDESGTYTIKYFSVDFAGNEETVKTADVEVFIDTEAPQTYVSESHPIDGNNGWYRSSPTISLTAVDPSGIKEIKYKLFPAGATTTAIYTSTVDISAAVDLTTNYNIKLEIDKSALPVEIDMRGASPGQTTITEIINNINTGISEIVASETGPDGAAGNGYITITSPTGGTEDPDSEVKFLQPSSNDATNEVFGLSETSYPHTFSEQVIFVLYTTPFTLPNDGIWQLNYYAIDNEDNQGDEGTKLYKLDSEQPVTTTTVNFPPDGDNGWYITNPEITLSRTDNESGVEATYYSWNNGIVLLYSDGDILQIPQEGINTLRFYSIDEAGNIESFKSEDFKYDISAPVTTDNTLELQGVIFTSRASGLHGITNENSDFLRTQIENQAPYTTSVTASVVQAKNLNVLSVTRFLNDTKNINYHVIKIDGPDRDELVALPLIENENSTRIDFYRIQLNTVVTGHLLRSPDDVLKIYNKSNSKFYTINPSLSNFTTGDLWLSGELAILVGDELEVTYAYNGPPIALGDVLEVDYQYDFSHEVDVLNTLQYTILTPTNTPRTHDHDVTIILTPDDSYAGAVQTFYTTDGSDPKTSGTVRQGTQFDLIENGTYTIRYYSKDAAGVEEDTKTAAYQIIIDKNVPVLDFTIISDPLEDGENGWHKKNFTFQADISTDDVVTIKDETVQESTTHRILTTENDWIDFEETASTELSAQLPSIEVEAFNKDIDFEETPGTELTISITLGKYTSEELRNEIETQLNIVGSSTYTVTFAIKKYTITSNLTGGTGFFNLLWQSGTNTNTSIAELLGFEKDDNTGSDSYQSNFEVKTFATFTNAQLTTAIKTALETVGASTYTVTIVDDKPFSVGYHFSIASDLSGGGGIFNLLWNTGTHSVQSTARTIFFDNSTNDTGSATYISDYFKALLANQFIKSSISVKDNNDRFDFEEESGVELTIDIPIGGYSFETLRAAIQLELNTIGSSNYTVTYASKKFTITSDLSGGTGIFNILWQSGTNSNRSLNKILGFKLEDDTSSGSYQSDYETTIFYIRNSTTSVELDFVEVMRSGSGFYDEVLIDGAIPDNNEDIIIDYTYFVGIEKVDFGLDTTSLTTSINVRNDLDKLLGIYGDKVNYRIVFPALSGQFFLQDGIHIVYGKAFDSNSIGTTGVPQKESTLQQVNFKLDRIVPVTTDNTSSYIGWQQGQAIIILDPTDATPGSGISKTHFTADGNIPTRLSPAIQDLPSQQIVLDQSGTYTIKYFSVDVAGNSEPVKTGINIIYVDATPPSTVLTTVPAIPDGDNGWFVTTPTIGFTVSEFQSGVDKTFYKLPGEVTFTEFTAPFLLPLEGAIDVTFFSIDNVGNVEPEKVATVKFDATPPVTTTNIPFIGYTSDSTVVFTINDASSGGQITYFTIDGSTPTTSSPSGSSVTFNSSGTYTVKYFSIDNAGNIESVETETLNLDLEVPIITNLNPPNGIVTDLTTVISFNIEDDLSGVDISTVIFEVDGIEYSQTKNTSYFHYTGTPVNYFVEIFPVQGVLNFEDIEVLKIRNVQDFAGNFASVIEFDFRQPDLTPPRVRELYPIPNAKDVSTNTNIVTFINDNESGVDIKSIKVTINGDEFAIITNDVLKVQYVGAGETSTITIRNNNFRTTVNGQPDLIFSLVDENYNTIKKVNDFIAAQTNYISSIIDSRFEQNASSDLLNISDVDMKVDPILSLFIPENNLNFAFIERELGYVVFVTPIASFETSVSVAISIDATDNDGNVMETYSYQFIPSRIAALSIGKRNYLNKTALTFINDIQNNIASNYTRSRSTHFYGHHKSIGIELARVQEELDHINEDREFTTVRDEFLYQKFGYLLEFPPSGNLSHEDYRRLLLSLLEILFAGSTKESLEKGTSLFTGEEVQIQEIVFAEGSDISDQFIFTADIVLGESRLLGLDLQLISEQLANMFRLVKPAHVFILQRFVWTDKFAFQAGCTFEWLLDEFGNYVLDQFGNKIPILDAQGFQVTTKNASTAICDRYRFEFESTYLEDMRTDCNEHNSEIQAIIEDISLQFTGSEDSFNTFYKPLLKSIQPPEVATASDVIVTVNGLPVTVIIDEFDPLEGYIKINVIPDSGDTVIVSYFYNPYFVYRVLTYYLNDFEVQGNDFNPLVGSLFNGGDVLQQNVYDVVGGFELNDRLHAHICETFLTFQIDQEEEDAYQIPECNDAEFFYLNKYTTNGNTFDLENGSYLNDIDTVNRSTLCPYHFIEIQDHRTETIELPQEIGVPELQLQFLDEAQEPFPDRYADLQSLTLDKFEDVSTALKQCGGFILNNIDSTLNSTTLDSIILADCDEEFITILDTRQETIDLPTESLYEEIQITDADEVKCEKAFFISPAGPTVEVGILNNTDFKLSCVGYDDNLFSITLDHYEDVSTVLKCQGFTLNDTNSTLNSDSADSLILPNCDQSTLQIEDFQQEVYATVEEEAKSLGEIQDTREDSYRDARAFYTWTNDPNIDPGILNNVNYLLNGKDIFDQYSWEMSQKFADVSNILSNDSFITNDIDSILNSLDADDRIGPNNPDSVSWEIQESLSDTYASADDKITSYGLEQSETPYPTPVDSGTATLEVKTFKVGPNVDPLENGLLSNIGFELNEGTDIIIPLP